jgi:hypothetical protein
VTALAFFEFSDGLIARITGDWLEFYEPPVRACTFNVTEPALGLEPHFCWIDGRFGNLKHH